MAERDSYRALTREELVKKLTEAETVIEAIQTGDFDAMSQDGRFVVQLTSVKRGEEHQKQVLNAIRSVNKLIASERNPGQLIREICLVITANLSYHNAWIVLSDEEGNCLDSASSGFEEGFRRVAEMFASEEIPSCVQKALSQDDVLVLKNPPVECPECPLSVYYEGRAGFTSPLRVSGVTFGVVSASVPLSFASDEREKKLFGELASDISLGLHRLRLESTRVSVESEKAQILDSISDAMISLDRNQNIAYFNRAAGRILCKDPEEVLGKNILEVFPQGNDPVFTQRYSEAITTGNPVSFETCFQVEPYANWYEIRLYPATDGSVSIYFTVTTERKHAEKAMRESEERLALVIEGAELGTWDWDITTGKVTFNQRWAEMLGYTLDELEGTPEQWEKLIHPDDLEPTLEALSSHMAGKSASYRVQHRLKHKSGEWVWVLDSGRVISSDAEGNPLRMCGTHTDVTESVLKDARIKLLGYMLDSAPASITVHDTAGWFLYANKATIRLHGYSDEDDFKKINLHQLDLPESERLLTERFRKIKEEGEASFEVTHFRKDGSTFPLQVHAKRIDWNGEPAVLSIASDVTQRMSAEQALHESEERFRILVENSPYAILLLQEGRYIYSNPAGAALLGFDSPSQIVGLDPFESISPRYREVVSRRMEQIELGEVNSPMEIVFVRGDGCERVSYTTSVSVTMNGKPTAIIVGQDVTDRKRMQEENAILEQRFQLFQRLESVGRLAGGVAHDLNNLLTPILGYGEMLVSEDSLEPTSREHAGQIVSAGERAKELVHQLLAFSRKQTLEFSRLDLNHLLGDFSSLLRRTISEDIGIEYELSDKPQLVTGDKGQLEQVVMNLAVNARDAMPNGGVITVTTDLINVSDRGTFENREMKEGCYSRLRVKDTGSGMDRELCDQIFEPFFTTKGVAEGTGLGLATVYGIVKQHEGYIWVDSEKNRGTVFSIYLPFRDEGDERTGRKTREQELEAGNETILLVEDDHQVRKLATEILSGAGYSILQASNGSEALSVLESCKHRIDLLLTDIVMLGLNGRELFELIRRKRPSIRVLYMSGYPDDVIASRGVVEKGINFIQKPFSAGILTARIRQILTS